MRYVFMSALILTWPFAQAIAQISPAGTVAAHLDADGRTFTLTAPGLAAFRGGFAAEVWVGGGAADPFLP